MTGMPGFPHDGYPEGWFGLGWSSEFPVGSVVHRRNFGIEMVVFRTESGRLVATQAYCPHMGARLDVGGKVKGECITCPFHAWQWDADGNNVHIPYAPDKTMNAKLRTFHVVESGPMAWIWYSHRSETPQWAAPDLSEVENKRFFWDEANSRREWLNLRLVPQMVCENIVDGVHIQYVHIAEDGGHIESMDTTGSTFEVVVEQTFRTGKGPVIGRTRTTSEGVGLQISRMVFGEYNVVNVLATTPVTEDHSDMRASIFIELPDGVEHPRTAAGLPRKLQKLILSHLDSQEQDIPLWETMIYEAHPLLVGEEVQGHVQLRKWAKQFYA